MASHEDFYSFNATSRPSSQQPLPQGQFQNFSPAVSNSTPPPPPPPPKPSSQETSRIGTPLSMNKNMGMGMGGAAAATAPPPPRPPHPQSTRPQSRSGSPRPPPPIPTTTSTSMSMSTSTTRPAESFASPAPIGTPAAPPPPPVPPPSLEQQWLPSGPPLTLSLPTLPTTDLAPVLGSAGLVTALARTHPSYGASLEPLQAALASNVGAATALAALEAHLAAVREATAQLLLQHTTLSAQWRRKQAEMDAALAPWGPDAMHQRLVAAIAEQEALVRAVQESFLEGDTGGAGAEYQGHGGHGSGKASEKEVNEWVRRIREGTTVLEKRREMRARWDEGRVGGWR